MTGWSFAALEAMNREDDLRRREMCAISLQLGDGRDGEADAADDEIRRHLMRSESQQLHGIVELDRAQDEAIAFKRCEPELKCVADAHRENRGERGLVGDRRVVVAIDDRDGLGWQQRLHADGLLSRDTNRDEAGPSASRGGAARAHLFENAERQLHQVERC